MAAVRDRGFQLVDHPPIPSYSPGFASFLLFSVPQHVKTVGLEAVSDR